MQIPRANLWAAGGRRSGNTFLRSVGEPAEAKCSQARQSQEERTNDPH